MSHATSSRPNVSIREWLNNFSEIWYLSFLQKLVGPCRFPRLSTSYNFVGSIAQITCFLLNDVSLMRPYSFLTWPLPVHLIFRLLPPFDQCAILLCLSIINSKRKERLLRSRLHEPNFTFLTLLIWSSIFINIEIFCWRDVFCTTGSVCIYDAMSRRWEHKQAKHSIFCQVKYRMRHKSVNRKCIAVYCSFNGFYKVISPTEIVQSDLHCYLDI
jgi:hypothetical protein